MHYSIKNNASIHEHPHTHAGSCLNKFAESPGKYSIYSNNFKIDCYDFDTCNKSCIKLSLKKIHPQSSTIFLLIQYMVPVLY